MSQTSGGTCIFRFLVCFDTLFGCSAFSAEQAPSEPPTTKVAGFLGTLFYRRNIYQAIPVVPTVLIYVILSYFLQPFVENIHSSIDISIVM